MENIKTESIAHLFPDTGPHLNRGIVQHVLRQFPTAVIYLRCSSPGRANVSELNREWIEKVPSMHFGGCLVRGGFWRLFKGRWGRRLATILSNTVLPYYGLSSWKLIWKGPKRWVYHSCLPMNIPTQLVFKIMGKEVVAIHWGLPLGHIPFVWPLVNAAHWFARKIFILMSPEKEYFDFWGCRKKVSVLSYPASAVKFGHSLSQEKRQLNRVMILGNSTYNRDLYGPVLDRIPPGSWDRIICMLNYGREEEKDLTDAFVQKYQSKFGDAFFAWRETLPIDEYMRIMDEASFYIGPAVCQSGLGAIFNSISQGKVVVIRGHNYKWLKELGVEVLDLDECSDLSYDHISQMAPSFECRQANVDQAFKFFSAVASEERWAREIWDAFESP